MGNVLINKMLSCIPSSATHQQKGVRCIGRFPRFYEKPRVKEARKLYMDMLKPHRPEVPFSGALSLEVMVFFPHRKSDPKKVRQLDAIWHDKAKPDMSNWMKLFEDCLEDSGYFRNDGQLAISTGKKFYAKNPGIFFKISSLTGTEAILSNFHREIDYCRTTE
jgi:Holliday junction resolvase RusA-like endonuclease